MRVVHVVVKSIDDFLKHKDIKLNVLLVPLGLAWEDKFTSGKQTLSQEWETTTVISQVGIESFTRDYLQINEVDYIELSKECGLYKRHNLDVSLFYDMDGHWNSDGHYFVCKILGDHYARKNTDP